MKPLASIAAGLLLASVASVSLAADNPISVHVLNTQTGKPSAGVAVKLEHRADGRWETIANGTTSEDGRISALYPESETFEAGVYRAVFETGDWYRARGSATFFPEITVPFEVVDTQQHYHIPLLLSPYAYSTYRGS
ncbi:MAG: hydroxyisourate hydrolase [Salinicola sp.]|uniref:hydroxyisourate hydrolase n=1 Tax=uncultured Salinicola sp. TaxID=1193542 RepID=UPI000C977439|nr:hydroxyisourate hydrolase [uncultured Salinicola sp.]MAM58722.1 hydroxyisourate hydrolase [Salinicola sp.]